MVHPSNERGPHSAAPPGHAVGALRTSDAPESGAPRAENLAQLDSLRLRFVDFLDYARTFRGHSVATLVTYRNAFRNFQAFLTVHASEEPDGFAVHLFAIEDWVRWNVRRGIRPITVNTYYRSLRAFFCDRETRDGIANPFRGHPAPAFGELVPKARTVAECQRILATARNYPWPTVFARELAVAVIGVMLYAGLRRGEVSRLEVLDVQLDQGTIRIRNGKGRHGGKDRTAYIAPDLDLILRAYLRERTRRRITAPEVFVTDALQRKLSEISIRRILGRVRDASGIPFTAHILRHSFVTQLLRSGVAIHVARDLAGHSSIETTMGYLRVFDEDRHEGIRKLRYR